MQSLRNQIRFLETELAAAQAALTRRVGSTTPSNGPEAPRLSPAVGSSPGDRYHAGNRSSTGSSSVTSTNGTGSDSDGGVGSSAGTARMVVGVKELALRAASLPTSSWSSTSTMPSSSSSTVPPSSVGVSLAQSTVQSPSGSASTPTSVAPSSRKSTFASPRLPATGVYAGKLAELPVSGGAVSTSSLLSTLLSSLLFPISEIGAVVAGASGTTRPAEFRKSRHTLRL